MLRGLRLSASGVVRGSSGWIRQNGEGLVEDLERERGRRVRALIGVHPEALEAKGLPDVSVRGIDRQPEYSIWVGTLTNAFVHFGA